ncbi:hypothetical protein Nepgr_009348 [Nepenthes gracilis]|uniref:Uncharacterized protein n=1 Tax=Nepenthes gracilis TaxID=150966 RepID=A0AAD3SAG4_NEPGR|nr:hypothetical protein Nepgr_009348 [Nepenthes gracilis]
MRQVIISIIKAAKMTRQSRRGSVQPHPERQNLMTKAKTNISTSNFQNQKLPNTASSCQFNPAKRKAQPSTIGSYKPNANSIHGSAFQHPSEHQHLNNGHSKDTNNQNPQTTPNHRYQPVAPPSARAKSRKDPSSSPHQTTHTCSSHLGDNR